MINGSVLLCWKSSDFAAPLLRTGSVQQFVAGVLLPVYWRMMCERYPWKVESKSKETVRVSNSEMVKKKLEENKGKRSELNRGKMHYIAREEPRSKL